MNTITIHIPPMGYVETAEILLAAIEATDMPQERVAVIESEIKHMAMLADRWLVESRKIPTLVNQPEEPKARVRAS